MAIAMARRQQGKIRTKNRYGWRPGSDIGKEKSYARTLSMLSIFTTSDFIKRVSRKGGLSSTLPRWGLYGRGFLTTVYLLSFRQTFLTIVEFSPLTSYHVPLPRLPPIALNCNFSKKPPVFMASYIIAHDRLKPRARVPLATAFTYSLILSLNKSEAESPHGVVYDGFRKTIADFLLKKVVGKEFDGLAPPDSTLAQWVLRPLLRPGANFPERTSSS